MGTSLKRSAKSQSSPAPACKIRYFRGLSLKDRLNLLSSLTDFNQEIIRWNLFGGSLGPDKKPRPWWTFARDEQLPPVGREWSFWVIMAGRGFGKTRAGAEWFRDKAETMPGSHGALVAKDPGEARDVMVEGRGGGSALLEVCPPCMMPDYEPSKKLLTWPNGSKASVYSSEEYDELRGPQHHFAWVDEPAKYRYLEQTLDNLLFGLRLGGNPQACFTTTPRPVKAFRTLLKDKLTVVTKGSTRANLSNLSPVYQSIIAKYEGTRLGRQEIDAELLEDTPGALWTLEMIDSQRLGAVPSGVTLLRVVIGVDPQAKSSSTVTTEAKRAERTLQEEEKQTETGVVVAARGSDHRGYILADLTISGRPEAWAARAIDGYKTFKADRIIGESNNGGEMVEAVLKAGNRHVPVRLVHASRGKVTRAEPVSRMYEQGKVSHVGAFPDLEDQMTTWVPGDKSPDRMDALVWAMVELFGRDMAFSEDYVDSAEVGEQRVEHDGMNIGAWRAPTQVSVDDFGVPGGNGEGMNL